MDFLLFDLGNVLMKFNGFASIQKWTGSGITEPQFWEKWLCSDSVAHYESGKIGTDEFAARIVKDFRLPVTPGEFLAEFAQWPDGFYDGAEKFLAQMRSRHVIGCLSNTNPVHLKTISDKWNIHSYFDYTFFSHELGCVKPSREIFEKVLLALPFERNRIVFFDDNPMNVHGAEAVWIKSFCVRGLQELRNRIESLEADGSISRTT